MVFISRSVDGGFHRDNDQSVRDLAHDNHTIFALNVRIFVIGFIRGKLSTIIVILFHYVFHEHEQYIINRLFGMSVFSVWNLLIGDVGIE